MNKTFMTALAIATVACSAKANADEILLKPEILTLQHVATFLQKMPPPVRQDWLAISETGRNLLTREAGAIAVTVSDTGKWSYRVPGQSTTARYEVKNSKQSTADETHVTAVLGSARVREILSIFSEPPSSASEEVAIKSFEAKLRRIDEGSRSNVFGTAEKKALLAATGRQLSSYDSAVVAKVRLQPNIAPLASEAEALAASQEANKSNLIQQFATTDKPSKYGTVAAGLILAPYILDAISTMEHGNDKVTVAEVPTPNGVIVLKCEGDKAQCTNTDGTLRGSKVTDKIFVPNANPTPIPQPDSDAKPH